MIYMNHQLIPNQDRDHIKILLSRLYQNRRRPISLELITLSMIQGTQIQEIQLKDKLLNNKFPIKRTTTTKLLLEVIKILNRKLLFVDISISEPKYLP